MAMLGASEDLKLQIEAGVEKFCHEIARRMVAGDRLEEENVSMESIRMCLHVHGDFHTTGMVCETLSKNYGNAWAEKHPSMKLCFSTMVIGSHIEPRIHIRGTNIALLHRATNGSMDAQMIWRSERSTIEDYASSPRLCLVVLNYQEMRCRWSSEIRVDGRLMDACRERGLHMAWIRAMNSVTSNKAAATILDMSMDAEEQGHVIATRIEDMMPPYKGDLGIRLTLPGCMEIRYKCDSMIIDACTTKKAILRFLDQANFNLLPKCCLCKKVKGMSEAMVRCPACVSCMCSGCVDGSARNKDDMLMLCPRCKMLVTAQSTVRFVTFSLDIDMGAILSSHKLRSRSRLVSCDHCGVDGAKKLCPCSLGTRYCDAACQMDGWNEHRKVCTLRKDLGATVLDVASGRSSASITEILLVNTGKARCKELRRKIENAGD